MIFLEITCLFIPLFFVMVEMQFDPVSLQEFDRSLFGFLALLLITLFLIKIVPSLIWTRGFDRQKAIAASFLMSSRLSMIIAIYAIGLQNVLCRKTQPAGGGVCGFASGVGYGH